MSKKKKLSYWKEFWYKRSENGVVNYEPNTRKFWATISWIMLILWMPVCGTVIVYGIVNDMLKDMPWGFITGITGILIGNAQMAIGWYTLDTNSKRKHSEQLKGVILESKLSNTTSELSVNQELPVIPES